MTSLLCQADAEALASARFIFGPVARRPVLFDLARWQGSIPLDAGAGGWSDQ
jgi:hypothetical protein